MIRNGTLRRMRGKKEGKEKADKVRKQKVMNDKRRERLGKVEMERCEREGKEKVEKDT